MHFLSGFVLVALIFSHLIRCDNKFIRPGELDKNQDADSDPANNIRYNHDDTINILWETDLDITSLQIWQKSGNEYMYSTILKNSRSTSLLWTFEYDFGGLSKNDEDSIYSFVIYEDGIKGALATSQYVNVSAPTPGETKYVTIATTLTFRDVSSTTEPSTEYETKSTMTPTTTDISLSEGAKSSVTSTASPGLSQGATAGVAIGALLGVLILGGLGWVIWKTFFTKKDVRDKTNSMGCQPGQHGFSMEQKAELPGDSEKLCTRFARTVPGLHEAP